LIKAHLALFAVAIIYGANYVIAKSVMPEPIGASAFIVTRVLGAGLIFWFIRAFVKEKVDKKDYWRLLVCGVTGVALNQLFFFNGLQLTSPMNASIIMTSNPIIVLIVASIMLKNRITPIKIAGIIAGMAGALGIIWLSTGGQSEITSVRGDLFILINSISYGFYLVLVKPLMVKYRPFTVMAWVFLFGSLVVFPVGMSEFVQIDWPALTFWQIMAVAFVVLGVTCLTYVLNIYALRRLEPTVASSYIYLQPLLAGVFSWLFAMVSIHDYTGDFSWTKVACALLIVAGVWMVSRSKNPSQLSAKI
jgi:drug/metabolite transporter (DMT)-like permease